MLRSWRRLIRSSRHQIDLVNESLDQHLRELIVDNALLSSQQIDDPLPFLLN